MHIKYVRCCSLTESLAEQVSGRLAQVRVWRWHSWWHDAAKINTHIYYRYLSYIIHSVNSKTCNRMSILNPQNFEPRCKRGSFNTRELWPHGCSQKSEFYQINLVARLTKTDQTCSWLSYSHLFALSHSQCHLLGINTNFIHHYTLIQYILEEL